MSLRFADSLKIKQLYVVVVISMLTNQNQYDFIIQGAGASGLWLAYWLNEMDVLRHQRLLIVEGDTKIGYEVSFTKHFYKPPQLRSLAEISADILKLEQEAGGLLSEITKGSAA